MSRTHLYRSCATSVATTGGFEFKFGGYLGHLAELGHLLLHLGNLILHTLHVLLVPGVVHVAEGLQHELLLSATSM